MKKLYTLLALVLTLITFAQAPQGFNYQATVRNSAGALIVNQNVNFKFNIMLNSATSLPVFSETHLAPTDDVGQVNLVIGQGTATTGTFSTINWGTGNYFLGIELNTGAGYVAMGTTQLLSVPYALYANSSGSSNSNFPNGTNIGDRLNWIWNGTAWIPTPSSALIPQITTTIISAVTNSTASSGGVISSAGGDTISAKGVCWSTSPNPTILLTTKTNNGVGTVTFTSNITGLLPITTYYVRAYATNSFGTAYGQEEVFTTLSALPSITTIAATSITGTTANSGGAISSDGGAPITDRGIVWSSISNPTVITNQGLTSDGTGIGSFTSIINQLTPGTLYYVRAYATNSLGTAYGNQITFTALPIIPTISTTITSSISSSSAISGGSISSSGGATITAKGVCWSTSPDPTIALTTKTNNGTGTGTFISNISSLSPVTTYYIRAYATNSAGTAYGQEEVFITLPVLPTLTTIAASSITSTTASSGGIISNDGGAPITNRGIVWSSISNPTIITNQGFTSDGTGLGSFTSIINQLTPGTLYYVRAYATNSLGTAYGNQITFTALPIIPTISTTITSSISSSSASSGGSISSSGGATITAKGVCWSTSPYPTIALTTKTNNGTGTGTFISNISSLSPVTTYYIRAYATNSAGTAYGNELSFVTQDITPLPNVTIGAQVWQNINLNVTTYRDGTPIPQVTDPTQWQNLTTGAWCYYNNDPANDAIYGKLYNWFAVAGIHDNDVNTPNKILAPNGWHIPTNTDWTTLTTFLGGESVAGGKMKSIGTSLWNSPNALATNESGFTGLPGGGRGSQGATDVMGSHGNWWSSSEVDSIYVISRNLMGFNGEINNFSNSFKSAGLSVRCIRD